MSVCFAKFHPNLIVGGTYSGQIVLWDNRNRKRTPVQKTPLSSTAHTVSVLLMVMPVCRTPCFMKTCSKFIPLYICAKRI